MYEEILSPINELIYYGFFYKQDGKYIDEIIEEIKNIAEKEINQKLNWDDFDHSKLEQDITEPIYDTYYTEQEFNQILKSIKINGVDEKKISVNIDIEDYKKRVVNFYIQNGLYEDYILQNKNKNNLIFKCPLCKNKLEEKTGRYGDYLKCTNLSCKFSVSKNSHRMEYLEEY